MKEGKCEVKPLQFATTKDLDPYTMLRSMNTTCTSGQTQKEHNLEKLQ